MTFFRGLARRHSMVVSRIFLQRCCSSCEQTNQVRVRFAPSPTGYLHLGSLRTALYNFLFAKSHGGTFILRIEDTDQKRVVPGAVEKLLEMLQWIHLVPDEGPTAGGDYGPYVQSQRLHNYQQHAKVLLEKGFAYHCFCSEKRLDLLRKAALRSRQTPKYDNKCRHLTSDEVKEKMEQGVQYCIRFKLEPITDPFDDLVFGPVKYNVAETEGDPVIMKADEFPTYHFANVVDDHLMKISHVLRGVEWQTSTTKHILLYRAFGWEPPQFAHLPVILNKNGKKLSKSQDDIHVEYYRSQGYFPEAVLNFITDAGSGFEHKERGGKTIQDFIKQFNLSKVSMNSGRLDQDKLPLYNRLELMRRLEDPVESRKLIAHVKQLVTEHFRDRLGTSDYQNHILSDHYIHTVLLWSQHRIHHLTDLVSKDMEFIWVIPDHIDLGLVENVDTGLLQQLRRKLDEEVSVEDFKKGVVLSTLNSFMLEHELQRKSFLKFLRVMLTGLTEGPGVAEMMEVLGKQGTLRRLQHAQGLLDKLPGREHAV